MEPGPPGMPPLEEQQYDQYGAPPPADGGYGPPPPADDGYGYQHEPYALEQQYDQWAPPPADDGYGQQYAPPPREHSMYEPYGQPQAPAERVEIQSAVGEMMMQSQRDPSQFEAYTFQLVRKPDGNQACLLRYWDDFMPQQKLDMECRLITKIIKGFDESQHDVHLPHDMIGLQLDYVLFPSMKGCRTKHLRIKCSSLTVRSAWLTWLIEETGRTPEDPHEHLHAVTPTKEAPADRNGGGGSPGVSPPPGSPPAEHDDDSSDDGTQPAMRKPPARGTVKFTMGADDDSSDGGVGGVAPSRVPVSPGATAQPWWQGARVPPAKLEASYKQTLKYEVGSPSGSMGSLSPREAAAFVPAQVATLQVRRASRSMGRATRPDGLAGSAQFDRIQQLDSHLEEMKRQRQQRQSVRRVGGSMAVPTSGEDPSRRMDTMTSRSGTLRLERRATISVGMDVQAEIRGGALGQDLQHIRERRAELQSQLDGLQQQRSQRSVRGGGLDSTMASSIAGGNGMHGGGSVSSFLDSRVGGGASMGAIMMAKGEGAAPRVKRLLVSLSAGPEYGRMSAPTKVLYDPTISVGAFDRLLRRQLGLSTAQYISLANEAGELVGTSEALQLPDGTTLYLGNDSPPPSPPGSDVDFEEGEPPSPPASMGGGDGMMSGFGGGGAAAGGEWGSPPAGDYPPGAPGDYPQGQYGEEQHWGDEQQVPGEYDLDGVWHDGWRDEAGVWHDDAGFDDGGAYDDQAGGTGVFYMCLKKSQARSTFDPNEKSSRKTEMVKRAQTIEALETRELDLKGVPTLRIHFVGGWVSASVKKTTCFVERPPE